MSQHLDKFLKNLEIEKNYSEHTLLNYRLDLNEFFAFLGHDRVTEVDYPFLRRFLAEMRVKQLKPRSVARKLSSLRSFFKFLQSIISNSFNQSIFNNFKIFVMNILRFHYGVHL